MGMTFRHSSQSKDIEAPYLVSLGQMYRSWQFVLGLSFLGGHDLVFYLCVYVVELSFDWCGRAFPASLLCDLGQGRYAGGWRLIFLNAARFGIREMRSLDCRPHWCMKSNARHWGDQ